MSAALERAARRLAGLVGPDRDWVLARLPGADALRVRELMERGPGLAEAKPEPQAPAEPALGPEAALERASAADVSRALQEEPDWLIALVLAKRRWPWDRELVASLEPASLQVLRELVASARAAAKARACDAAVDALAARLRELAPAPRAGSAFDELLAGMVGLDATLPQKGPAWRA